MHVHEHREQIDAYTESSTSNEGSAEEGALLVAFLSDSIGACRSQWCLAGDVTIAKRPEGGQFERS